MKQLSFFALLLSLIFIGAGCSSSTSTDESSITMESQLASQDVNRMITAKGQEINGLTFDTLVVTSVRVFVKDIKLHFDKDDSDKDVHPGTIKTGPFVLIFDSAGAHSVSTSTIPPGDYDRIKFEIHKPNANDAGDAAILADSRFSDFAGGHTVIVKGWLSKAGTRTAFTIYSNKTKNVMIHIKDDGMNEVSRVTVSGGGHMKISLRFDPSIEFKKGGALFDPRDGSFDIGDDLELAIFGVKM